jgi:hypothetical protein
MLFRFKGESGGILLMWDGRVVEKIEECVGEFLIADSFKNVKENFLRLLQVLMALMPIVIGFYGMNWLVCLVGGTCLGAFFFFLGEREISMSLIFLL